MYRDAFDGSKKLAITPLSDAFRGTQVSLVVDE